MEYIHVKNLEKHHPGYKDRTLLWCKIYFNMLNGEPEFEMLEEIDKWRFIAFIILELQSKKPIPLNDEYLTRKGFNLQKRPISLTLQMLHNFISYENEKSKTCVLEESRREENRVDILYTDFEKSVYQQWNTFCEKNPTLSQIREVSGKRREKLKKRFESKSFRDFGAILNAIPTQRFLLGKGNRDWVVSFDWLIENDTNYLKVLEGRYKDIKTREEFEAP